MWNLFSILIFIKPERDWPAEAGLGLAMLNRPAGNKVGEADSGHEDGEGIQEVIDIHLVCEVKL